MLYLQTTLSVLPYFSYQIRYHNFHIIYNKKNNPSTKNQQVLLGIKVTLYCNGRGNFGLFCTSYKPFYCSNNLWHNTWNINMYTTKIQKIYYMDILVCSSNGKPFLNNGCRCSTYSLARYIYRICNILWIYANYYIFSVVCY